MNLYLLTRKDDIGYNQYDALVVAADTAEAALKIEVPEGWLEPEYVPEYISVKQIGVACDDIQEGIILGSYNAA